MRPFLRLENEQKSCAIWVYSFLEIALKEYRNRNASGAVYEAPRVAVGAGRFDGVGAASWWKSSHCPVRRENVGEGKGAQRNSVLLPNRD